jgi:predicted transcriptional regulator
MADVLVMRLNVTLDDQQAERLARLAARMHVQPSAIARTLLSDALDEADAGASTIVELLDGMPDARERAQIGLQQAKAGQTASLEDV